MAVLVVAGIVAVAGKVFAVAKVGIAVVSVASAETYSLPLRLHPLPHPPSLLPPHNLISPRLVEAQDYLRALVRVSAISPLDFPNPVSSNPPFKSKSVLGNFLIK